MADPESKTQIYISQLEQRIQIEEALERVRARAMAMHHSDDILKVTGSMFDEYLALGMPTIRCGIGIVHDISDGEAWATAFSPEGTVVQVTGHVSFLESPVYRALYDAWERQEKWYRFELAGENLKRFLQAIFTELEIAQFSDKFPERQVINYFGFPQGGLYAVSGEELTEQNGQILQRFAEVFHLTYTRYQDLKQAEEQAQEAQIEAALERVRARSMAMHHTSEISDVISVVCDQLCSMGYDIDNTWISIFHKNIAAFDLWHTVEGKLHTKSHTIPIAGNTLLETSLAAWKNGETSITYQLSQDEVKTFYQHIASITGDPSLEQNSVGASNYEFIDTRHRYGTIGAGFAHKIPAGFSNVMSRFARVFEQTYTRFQDLKRVEAQAHEAQIEAALERVRTHTMAMGASEELADMASVMFDNLLDLFYMKPSFTRCVIVITHEDQGVNHVWSTDFAGRSLTSFRLLPLEEHPVQAKIYAAWKEDKSGFIAVPFDQQAAFKYTTYLAQLPGFNQDEEVASVLEQMKVAPANLPEYFYLNMAFFSHGRVGMITAQELNSEQIHILKRFARVFEQTYTRFLDLQKAEALARETRQQASLDRVRGEIASMRTPEDLQRITPLIWRELTALDVPFFRCGVFIMNDVSRSIRSFVTTPKGEHLASLTFPYDSGETTLATVNAWRNNEVFTDQWDKQQFIDWTNMMLEKGLIDSSEEIPDYDDPPEFFSLHFVPFTQGMLYVGSHDALSEEQIKLVQSLADSFSVAYARYDDFTALESKNEELARTLTHLETTQAQLIQSEKMASLGQLTAGIAHELKNPLNFVNNFSQISLDIMEEMTDWIEHQGGENEQEMLRMLTINVTKIKEHGERADNIVTSMMQHARGQTGYREPVAINALIDEYISLASHGIPHQESPALRPIITKNYAENAGETEMMQQEIGQVLVNLLNNAYDAMHERSLVESNYVPALTITTSRSASWVKISVSDNGLGIPQELRDKIFEPFFTTKPTGQGTGLGLSLSYDIIKNGHGGELTVESEAGQGTTFTISLPVTP